MYQGTMHNRLPSHPNQGLLSREIGVRDALVLAPLVVCILALSLYPQLILERTNPSVEQTMAKVTKEEAPESRLAQK
jgi:NADH:ubiquinone oxidoreductase subunit 4 (subunit M)